MSNAAASWRKLNDGSWGVWSQALVAPGAQVLVTKASGETSTVTISTVVEQRPTGCLCRIVPSPKKAAAVQSAPRVRRNWKPCGYPGCNPSYCDECDGEGYRGWGR